ncbi:MAG: FAD-dependent oxidoreductase [Salinarimonas sp.]|nr:FAD-dependent oxidoreductase [Salinarimonas sp.]
MQSRPNVAIIGAGMAGAAASARFAGAGLDVTLFDKSRGAGGRMATRRLDGGVFDHGAQYFRARGARFADAVQRWQEAGLVAVWDADHHDDDAHPRFVGTPSMNAPVKALIGDLPVHTGNPVTALHAEGSRWRVAAEGAPDTLFDGVLIAIPSNQARTLAASAGWNPAALAKERYAPCLTLMLGYPEPVELPASMAIEDETIAWIADNSSKPDRPLPRGESDMHCVVIHATPDWSRTHLEQDMQEVIGHLYARYVGMTGIMDEPIHGDMHRWRYAQVTDPLGEPCLITPDQRLAACGDWCLGPRVEAAFDSGEAAAAALLERL